MQPVPISELLQFSYCSLILSSRSDRNNQSPSLCVGASAISAGAPLGEDFGHEQGVGHLEGRQSVYAATDEQQEQGPNHEQSENTGIYPWHTIQRNTIHRRLRRNLDCGERSQPR